MRRFSCLLAFVMLGLGLAVAAPPAAAETMTWTMRSTYDYRVQVEFFSQERKAAWPGGGKAYPLDDSKPHAFKLNCQRGEKICYGAWPTGGGSTYWGVGANNKHTCKTCCAVGCEPKLWDQAAAFDDASGWLRLAGADGLSASAAQ